MNIVKSIKKTAIAGVSALSLLFGVALMVNAMDKPETIKTADSSWYEIDPSTGDIDPTPMASSPCPSTNTKVDCAVELSNSTPVPANRDDLDYGGGSTPTLNHTFRSN
ncbi:MULTISPECIES: hypothetical protein [Sphingobacterium]|uniref:hypothetical protein n=1 Tax=Sphingobacterium TaxID=28453 RepID=UPI000E923C9F|nr:MULTISPECIES: hypothetical protein [Sphingobacterium]HAU54328.1 hypothetical protein [Sphingobacterium sp.]HCX63465.1 hypothetical protein [Clostridiales bacterium]